MPVNTLPGHEPWQKRAAAFVIRSRHHLWGKNSETAQAFLFRQGLNNDFIKHIFLGWNKFGQKRRRENWGIPGQGPLFLPPGVVIPVIEDKVVTSIFIHAFDPPGPAGPAMVQGSLKKSVVLGAGADKPLLVIPDLYHGLFAHQELGSRCAVLIHPDGNQQPDPALLEWVKARPDSTLIISPAHSFPAIETFTRAFDPDNVQHISHREQILKIRV